MAGRGVPERSNRAVLVGSSPTLTVGVMREALKTTLKRAFTPKQRRRLRSLLSPFVAGDLNRLATIQGTDKWNTHWYTPHYQTHFRHLRKKKLNILEIGVGGYDDPDQGGESLRMWKRYFPKSSIYSIDIYDKSRLQEDRIQIFTGSQDDEAFLSDLFQRIGSLDIVIDDGSHVNEHVIKTFEILYPLLNNGGIYVIEDVQTSYWTDVGGDSTNLDNPSTIMGYFKSLVDCLNYEEFDILQYKPTYYDRNIVAMHFYHNLIFVHKGRNNEGSTRELP